MGVMPRLATRLDRTVLASVTTFLGRRPAVLAWTSTSDGYVIGLPGSMLVGDGQNWRAFGWHQIATGQWEGASGRLTWIDADSRPYEATLESGGRFAELFNERVSASVLVSVRVDLADGGNVTLALRRNLEAGSDQTFWQVIPGTGVDVAEPATRVRIEKELAAAKANFGLA